MHDHDLFKVCEELITTWDSSEPTTWEIWRERLSAVRVAIAKSRNGSATLTHLEVVKLLRDEISRTGSANQFALKWGMTPSYLSDFLNYRCQPGPKILKALGLEKVVTVDYRRNEAK